jgi:tetratricopeptide (TPR) repeat protein
VQENRLNRRKSAMLLFEIEESFGEFIKEKISDIGDIPSSVLDTLQERKLEIEVTTIDHVVERTYLSEIFQLASVATDSTSFNQLVNEISKLAVLYELYDIRNAIAHPNRTFPNCYWYRVAAFASDPLIAALGIKGIHECLISAEEGSITDPPDEWLDNSLFEIRNNLPRQFEHDVTGLIGREKENEKLINLLTNPRVNTVAVVAPGGYGKTALVLDMLQQQVTNPRTATYADAIIFISLKTESLTIDGIKNQSAPQTIEQLKTALTKAAENTYEVPFDNFPECVEYLEDQKLLVCIDNLETLLRDNPEAFDELNLELPPLWRILVTSRTMISSNQSITLEPLGKKHSVNLINSYIKKKGGKNLGKEFSGKIATDCYFNPLAIRLSIDKILNGSAVHSAITSTKTEIAEFSFRNLIESLSANANTILEALLLSGESDKIYLCSLLQISLDDLSSALRELIPTSLLSRKIYDDVELFDLSSSIRDLLLLDTKNLFLREKILTQKNSLESQASEVDKKQKELEISILNVTHIPKNTNQSLKILLESFHRCRHSDVEKMAGILKEFKKSYETFKNLDIFQREYARLSSFLRDYRTAIEHAKIAADINPKQPLNTYVVADSYFRSKDYQESTSTYLKLITICNELDITDKNFLARIYHGTFQSMLWKGDYPSIIGLTDNWEEQTQFSALFGGYRATAYKRTVENSFSSNINRYVDGLTKSIEVMDRVFDIAGYLKSPCIQSLKIILEIEYVVPRLHTESQWEKFCLLCINFIQKNYKGIIDQQSLEKNTELKIKHINATVKILKDIDIVDNPLANEIDEIDNVIDADELDPSYVEVQVYHVMKDSNRKFARDKNGAQYFLTKDNTSSDLYSIWESISEGQRLYVIPSDKIEVGKAIPVLDILEA